MENIDLGILPYVEARLVYTAAIAEPARVRIFPPNSGRPMEIPPREKVNVRIYDCRPLIETLTLDEAGFEVVEHRTTFGDFYDAERVKTEYYPESAALMKRITGATEVFVFDHNVRNKPRSDAGQAGVRMPVEGAHNDYTLNSGPRRIREILADHDALHLAGRRAVLINLWRPIVGPVQDHPLAICHARATSLDDFIPTEIQHFLEGDLEKPHLTGEIYSFQHSAAHRWFYLSEMQPDEVFLLKCFDTASDGRALFTGHTGFRNPACPAQFKPRESIEVRTLAVFD